MKIIKALVVAVTATVVSSFAHGARTDNPVLRIMPLGDSITYGSCSESGGGYRAPLWELLTNGNYNVDYVGTQTNNPRKDGSLGDVDHEGHGGWRLSSSSVGVYENINAWFAQIRDPHVILLHLGTNDTGDGETTFCNQATNRLVKLLDRIHECQPSAKIVVTTLLRRIGNTSNDQKREWIERAYNPFIEGIVAEQRTKGQDAYFLDMCAAVTDDGLYTDGLHPKDTGYAMMANAWYAKLQELYPDPTTVGGVNTPALVNKSVTPSLAGCKVEFFFNQPMDTEQLVDAANWTVTGTTAAWTATANNGGKSVVLTFDRADFGKTVTISAAGLRAAESAEATFDLAAQTLTLTRAAGIEYNVSTAARAGYELIYDLNIPVAAKYQYNKPAYKTDNHAKIGAFSRVGYYLELQKSGGDVQYVWVSMDAFTDDASKIGVPTGWTFQKDVANLFIESNVAGLRTGETIPLGNIEFWPDSYAKGNKRGLAGADASIYDHDDTPNGAGTYYGSMQVHDTALAGDGCIFAYNRWASATDNSDIGIGKCTTVSTATDWTQTYNSPNYTLRHLQVYALPAAATVAPTVASVTRDVAGTRLTVTFSTPVADGSLAGCFALKGGRITKVTRDANDYSVVYVDYVADGTDELELTVAGVHEASSALLAMAAPVTIAPTVSGVPAEIASLVGDASLTQGYDVLYQVDIPATHVNWLTAETDHTDVPYTVKREDYPRNVDRVAYFLELIGNSGRKWVWVSMDAFSPDVKKFGVPISADRAVKQQWVKNMDVKSNVSGVVNGTNMDGGFIEFWHMNYSGSNALNIPGAASSCDFGDSMTGNGNYGCMQVHSVTNKQTIFAFNNFGKNNSSPSCLGIGNDTYKSGNGVNPDWTFHYTATDYTSRRLWVFVRPGAPVLPAATAPAAVTANVPEAANFKHLYTLTMPASGTAAKNPTSYASYHTVDNRAAFQGAKPSRVAYYMELVKTDGTTNWCWTAFNPITDNLNLYSLPTNTVVQQRLSNFDVRSNVAGVTEVTGSETGNIEFFPGDYNGSAKLGLPGAASDQYDFDDTSSGSGSYGCMQIHNWGAKQTCWAMNHLNSGTLEIGIGNYSSTRTDWTLIGTGTQYSSRKIYVLMQYEEEAPDLSAGPALRRVVASRDCTKICVEFAAEPPADYDTALYEIVTVRTGAVVKEVTRSTLDPREYIITLTRPLAAGTSYTLKGSVKRAGGPVAFSKAFTTPATTFAAPHLTAENIPELGDYRLVNEFAFGSGGVSITANGADYTVDESRFGVVPFDRIAYYLELEGTNGVTQWAWASMDAFTSDAAKIGLPTVQRKILFQQIVDNLTVYSGAEGEGATAAAVAGTFATGNVEIWPCNYGQSNSLGVPGASASVFDFGDQPSAGATSAGYGCLQVHDYLNQRTVLAINCLNGTPALGIGNDTTATSNGLNPDWTHHGNAPQFKTRRFYAFVRPVTASTGAAFDVEPADATVDVGSTTELVASATGATSYQWLVDGVVVAGVTGPSIRLADLSEGAHTVQAIALFADGTQTLGRTTTLTVAWPEEFQTQQIRIMPLGDSITQGVVGDKSGYKGGYRRKLYEKLVAAHYSVDFVGSTTADSGDMADPQHEGHSGWWISHPDKGLYENILKWSAGILNPHVVLMLIGTNDVGGGDSFKTKINVLDDLIDRVADAHPGAYIIVSPLLERSAGSYATIQTYFNPFVRERVQNHQLKGQKVRFWDVASYVPLSDMADQLHPGEVGYEKMAQGWFDAISEIWPTPMDVEVDNTPGILTVTPNQTTRLSCTVVFNTPLDTATATDAANWTISGGTVASVALASDKRTATVTFAAPLPYGAMYTLSVKDVQDEGKTAAMPLTARDFYLSIPQGVANYVPATELGQYEKVYAIDLPSKDAQYDVNTVKYTVDNHLTVKPFSRIAYYMELRRPNENMQYVWVSMDAFTSDAAKIGIPVKATQALFNQKVSNLKIWSNIAGVTPGERAEGKIEFWSTSYDQSASLGLSGASSAVYDFDDKPTSGGYGSFQVHDFENATTLFAYNRWNGYSGSAQDLGLGNCTRSTHTDWTFLANSAEYDIRHLEVWTMPDVADATPPAPVSARLSDSGLQLLVTFDSALDPDQALAGLFELSDGTLVRSAAFVGDGNRTVRLTLATPATAAGLQVRINGVRNASPTGTKMTTEVALDVGDVIPATVKANVGTLMDGYKLVYDLAVPERGTFNAKGAKVYDIDDSAYFSGNFDRVGYYFELVKANLTTQYVWASFKSHTTAANRLGIPYKALNCYFQQMVEEMDVKSNVSGISNGTGFTQGNIEFWPTDYTSANKYNNLGASSSNYDWDDTRSTGGSHGSFQVHNGGQKQVLFALSNWGADGNVISMGIGNNTSGTGVDWTFANNANNFVSRRLLVFVRPSETSRHVAPEQVLERVADAANFEHLYTVDIPVKAMFNNSTSNAAYHVVNNATALGNMNMGVAPKRVAYFLELVDASGQTNWIWTAMDAFTNTLAGFSVPVRSISFKKVANLDVASNVSGIPTGTGKTTGNVEFCGYNYSGGSSLKLGGSSAYDYDDSPGTTGSYGCMQVHDYGAKKTLWAINNFNTMDNNVCIGIGDSTGSATDWTHVYSAGNWASRKLYVFAQWNTTSSTAKAASFRRVTADTGLQKLCCTFDEAIDATQSSVTNFTFTGATVVKAEVSSTDSRDVILTLGSALTANTSYSVAYKDPVSGTTTSKSFTTPKADLPAVLANVDEVGGYVLVNEAEIPTAAAWSHWGPNYVVDASRFGGLTFDRVAYCLELVGTNGVSQWAWTSMDAFTTDLAKLGVPSVKRSIFWQQYVQNLHVRVGSTGSAPDVTTGDFARGNLEFWPGNYGEGNQKGIEGASGTYFDFGDSANDDARRVGYGSMQVHATDQKKTVWAFNSFGSSSGVNNTSEPGLGIGNCPQGGTKPVKDTLGYDWTHIHNARSFATRKIYVLVRPSEVKATSEVPFMLQPQDRSVLVGSAAFTLSAFANGATAYQWYRDGKPVAGATASWIEIEPNKSGTSEYTVAAVFSDGTMSLSESATVNVFTRGTTILFR